MERISGWGLTEGGERHSGLNEEQGVRHGERNQNRETELSLDPEFCNLIFHFSESFSLLVNQDNTI